MRPQTQVLIDRAQKEYGVLGWVPSRVAVAMLECERGKPFRSPWSAAFYQWKRNEWAWIRRTHCECCGNVMLEVYLPALIGYLETYRKEKK